MYQFSIASVETFERQLEQAQREIGMDPSEFVPVRLLCCFSSFVLTPIACAQVRYRSSVDIGNLLTFGILAALAYSLVRGSGQRAALTLSSSCLAHRPCLRSLLHALQREAFRRSLAAKAAATSSRSTSRAPS